MACSFGNIDSPCDSYRQHSSIVPLLKCDRDMTSYLSSLPVSLKRSNEDQTILSEINLILNRAGRFNVDEDELGNMTICPKHREELSLEWPGRKRRTCSHPLHKGQRKQLKSFRRVNASMSTEIFTQSGIAVPIGSSK